MLLALRSLRLAAQFGPPGVERIGRGSAYQSFVEGSVGDMPTLHLCAFLLWSKPVGNQPTGRPYSATAPSWKDQ